MSLARLASVLSFASFARGQYGPGGWYGPYSSGSGSYNPFSSGSGFGFGNGAFDFNGSNGVLIAHGVLASLAFVIFFPTGAILIRLASFPGLWLVHGLFQIFAIVVYTAAFALGVHITQQAPSQVNLIGRYHPIIGIVLFAVVFIQVVLGFIHHFQFKKYGRRTLWSHGHLWLGRLLITLGMINGGLGLLLATQTRVYAPSTGQIAAYGAVAGVMWLLWVAASIIGERRRSAARRMPMHVYKEQYA